MGTGWPLVGRRGELATIEATVRGDGRRAVVLIGPAGVGKTRLLREGLALAKRNGQETATAVATRSAAKVPFGALAHLLPADLGPAPTGSPTRSNLLRVAAEALVDDVDRPLVLGIDDAHLLDPLSAALVHQLGMGSAVTLLVALRSGDGPDAVTALWKDELADSIEIGPLDADTTSRLLEAALGGAVVASTARRLWSSTRGNPLLLRELVLGARADGVLAPEHGVWRWQGSVPRSVRLTELVETRLAGLDRAQRTAIETLAVAGPVDPAVLATTCGDEAAAAVEQRGLVTVEHQDDRRVAALSHPVIGDVVDAGLPYGRRAAIMRRLARVHDAAGPGRDDRGFLQHVVWRLDGDQPVDAPSLVAAARRCLALLDFELAERLARAAVDAGGGLPARLVVAEGLIGAGRAADAEGLLAALQAGANESHIAAVASIRAETLFWRLARPDKAEAVLRDAEAAVHAPRERQELTASRGMVLLFSGATSPGVDLLETLVSDPTAASAARLRAAPALLWCLGLAGDCVRHAAIVDDCVALLDEDPGDDWLSPIWLRTNLPTVDLFAGRFADAEASIEAVYQEAVERWPESVQGLLAFATGTVQRLRGHAVAARDRQQESVALVGNDDLLQLLPACLAELAHTEALLGRTDAATAALDEAEAHRRDFFLMDQAFLGFARTAVLAARGETSAAVEVAHDTAGRSRELGQHSFEAMALHDALRLGDTTVAEPLLELSKANRSPLVDSFAARATATRGQDVAALVACSETFEQRGADLYAAETAATASRLYRAAGRRGSALAMAERARRLARRCGQVRAVPLLDLEALPLTAREREVATMAAAGSTDAEIAASLHLSIRTVNNHLHHAYTKLGIDGRGHLSEILQVGPERPDTP
jgi:DNA-binding CsgD family transcriptional regulator